MVNEIHLLNTTANKLPKILAKNKYSKYLKHTLKLLYPNAFKIPISFFS